MFTESLWSRYLPNVSDRNDWENTKSFAHSIPYQSISRDSGNTKDAISVHSKNVQAVQLRFTHVIGYLPVCTSRIQLVLKTNLCSCTRAFYIEVEHSMNIEAQLNRATIVLQLTRRTNLNNGLVTDCTTGFACRFTSDVHQHN